MRQNIPIALSLVAAIACESKKPAGNETSTTPTEPTTASDHESTEGLATKPSEPPPANEAASNIEPGDVEPLAIASNALGFDLYKTEMSSEGNLAFSPASISLAFAMTYAGAAGTTAAEMRQVLHLPENAALLPAAAGLLESWNQAEAGYELKVVNRLFGDRGYTFEAPFLDVTKNVYKAPLESVDFRGAPNAQRSHINSWVEEQTESRIKELLPDGSIDGNTRLVLTNAVYFLGEWQKAFQKEQTTPLAFFVNGTEKTQVPMMRQTETFGFAQLGGLQVLRMPYAGSTLAMTVVLPNDKAGLPALEKSMSVESYRAWSEAVSDRARKVRVSFPSFEIDDAKFPLKKSLEKLGMRLAFDAASADFTAMANPAKTADQLYITDAFHKAFVKVDEKGTEAAAATAVVMGRKGAAPSPSQPPSFTADHPFLFFIEDSATGTVLFMGRVVDPR